MIRNLLSLFIISLVLTGCSSENIDLSDPLNTGREFIRASLKSDYATAGKYMLRDSVNNQYLDRWRDFSTSLSPADRESYAEASIIIDSTKTPNDTTEIIFYRNSFKKEPTKIKVLNREGLWKVDFKYTFSE